MSKIKFECSHCQKKLAVAQGNEGRKIRCPGCQEAITIPSQSAPAEKVAVVAASPAPAQPPAKPALPKAKPPAPRQQVANEQWFAADGEGKEHGPLSYATLGEWVQSGRLDAHCQVYQEGWPEWKMAEEQFPVLREGGQGGAVNGAAQAAPAEANPFDFTANANATSSLANPSVSSRYGNKKKQWKWGWNPMIGITYGPVPVGLIVAGVVVIGVLVIKVILAS